jgi:hypothetical protein
LHTNAHKRRSIPIYYLVSSCFIGSYAILIEKCYLFSYGPHTLGVISPSLSCSRKIEMLDQSVSSTSTPSGAGAAPVPTASCLPETLPLYCISLSLSNLPDTGRSQAPTCDFRPHRLLPRARTHGIQPPPVRLLH